MILPPRPDLYICGRQARVVRKAPSRWIASIFFQSASVNSSIGCTIWMPALLTRISTPPNVATTAATPALTASSLQTSIATPIAWPSRELISLAVASAAALSRSAMATLAPSRAKMGAISLPMPLAEPVTIADLPLSFMLFPSLFGIVVDNSSQSQRHVGQDVDAAEHFAHGKRRDRGKRMVEQLQRCRSIPGALHGDVLHEVANEFADARAAVDMWNDLQQEVWCGKRIQDRLVRKRSVLVAHRRYRDGDGSIAEDAAQRILFDPHLGRRQLFGKTPKLASPCDRRVIVQIHCVHVPAPLAAEAHRDDLAAFRVV